MDKKRASRQYYLKHREEAIAHQKQYYKENRAQVLAQQRANYQQHKEGEQEKSRQYYRENRTEVLRRRKEFYRTHKEQLLQQWRVAREKVKIEVFAHYGNGKLNCVICGESRVACLSIDHIKGGGNAHRKRLKAMGSGFLRWLKKNNYPEGYQTLCMNCQFVKKAEENETKNRYC